MEQLKPSEEKIIALGKKLIKELNLVNSTDTISRWMANYLAELIENINCTNNKEDNLILKKECCDLIIKIWERRDILPIEKPFDDLKSIAEIVEVLKEEKDVRVLPRWIEYNPLPRESEWAAFVDLVKNNSEKIFDRVFQINLHKSILLKDQEWMIENKEFLSKDEVYFLEQIQILKDLNNRTGVIDLNDFGLKNNNKEKVSLVFKDLEKLIDEQKKSLAKIKKEYLDNFK